MRKLLCIACIFTSFLNTGAQELYVFTEPASNMPAKSMSLKLTGNFMGAQSWHDRPMQRYIPEIMFGLSKKWMLHVGTTFSDMHTPNFRWESAYVYAKYRFLSNDELHTHFRMALFAEGAYSRSPFHNDEVSLQGDKSGLQVGLIATQLWHKLAVSGTVSHTQVLDESRTDKILYVPERIYQVMNYSASAGYLLLPREYTDYKQLNINLYTELLAQQALDRSGYYIDLAPAIQVIFGSNTKLNVGYRFEINGDMSRMADKSWLISLERTFLNALRKKK